MVDVVRVRAATVDDAVAVARVRVAGWRAGYRGVLEPQVLDQLDPAADLDRLARTIRDGVRRVAVATTGNAVVGFTIAGTYRVSGDDPPGSVGPDDGELMACYVDPGSWSRGVGSALVVDAVAALAATGAPVVRLWVLAGNDRARRLYARHGFTPDGVTAPYTAPGATRSVDELRMSRPLP